jgi:Mce-associated membrane protein
MATTTRSRSTSTAKRPTRARKTTASTTRSTNSRARSIKSEAQSVFDSATKAVKSVPLNRTTVSIGVGALAAAALAGVAAFIGRERLTKAATSGAETLKKVADDVSTIAHEKIDQARDNITRLRQRSDTVDAKALSDDVQFAAVG